MRFIKKTIILCFLLLESFALAGLQDPLSIVTSLKKKAKDNSYKYYRIFEKDGSLVEEKSVLKHKKIIILFEAGDEDTLGIIQKYLDKTLENKKIETIISNLKSVLTIKGYPAAKIKIANTDTHKTLVEITNKNVCTLGDVIDDQKNDNRFVDILKEIKNCRLDLIEKKIVKKNEDNKKKYFINSNIKIRKVAYREDFKKMDVYLSGTSGKKHAFNYTFTKDSRTLFEKIFSDALEEHIDFSSFSPLTSQYEIIDYFQSKGYMDVKVEYFKSENKEKNELLYNYKISIGKRSLISSIEFDGNFFLKDSEIMYEIKKELGSLPLVLTPHLSNLVKKIINNLYLKKGFWRVSLDPKLLKTDTENKLLVMVNEGKRRVLSNVSVNIENFKFSEVVKNDSLPLDYKKIIRNELTNYLNNLGYYDISFEFQVEKETKYDAVYVDIKVNVTKGSLYIVESVHFKGLKVTKDSFLHALIGNYKDKVYTPKVLTVIRKKLMEHSIFQTIHFEKNILSKTENKLTKVKIIVFLQEGNFGNVSFGPGISLQKGMSYQSEISYKNIFGAGERVVLSGSISQEKQQEYAIMDGNDKSKTILGHNVTLSFMKPLLFKMNLTSESTINNGSEVVEHIWIIRNLLQTKLSYNIDWLMSGTKIGSLYRYKGVDERGGKEDKINIASIGSSKISMVGAFLSIDQRNSVSWPTKGFLTQFEYDIASDKLGGHYKYNKWKIKHNFYASLFWDLVWVFGMQFSAYERIGRIGYSHDRSMLPVSERLYADGNERVRGFIERLGPYSYKQNSKTVIGGDRMAIFKTELRYPLIKNKLGIGLFWDLGNNFLSNTEYNKFSDYYKKEKSKISIGDNFNYDFNELLYKPRLLWENHYISTGISFVGITPLGSLALSFAYPVSEPKGDLCKKDNVCFSRTSSEATWWKNINIGFSVGTKF